jgi:hypothetical protein
LTASLTFELPSVLWKVPRPTAGTLAPVLRVNSEEVPLDQPSRLDMVRAAVSTRLRNEVELMYRFRSDGEGFNMRSPNERHRR